MTDRMKKNCTILEDGKIYCEPVMEIVRLNDADLVTTNSGNSDELRFIPVENDI